MAHPESRAVPAHSPVGRHWVPFLFGMGWAVEIPPLIHSALRLDQNFFLIAHLFWTLAICALFIAALLRRTMVRRGKSPILSAGIGAAGGMLLSGLCLIGIWGERWTQLFGAALLAAAACALVACRVRTDDEGIGILSTPPELNSPPPLTRSGQFVVWPALLLATFCLWIRPWALLLGDPFSAISIAWAAFVLGAAGGWWFQESGPFKVSLFLLKTVGPIGVALAGILALNVMRLLGLSDLGNSWLTLAPVGSLSQFLVLAATEFLLVLAPAFATGIALRSLHAPIDLRKASLQRPWVFLSVFLLFAAMAACLPFLRAVTVVQALLGVQGLLLICGAANFAADGALRRDRVGSAVLLACLILLIPWAWKARALESEIEVTRLNAGILGGRFLESREWPFRISVMQFPNGARTLLREGVIEYGHGIEGRMMVYLPYILHGSARNCLTLGFGEGHAGATAMRLGLQLEWVEASGANRDFSRYFVSGRPPLKAASWNRFIRSGAGSYDLVVVDLPRPLHFPPAGGALSQEFLGTLRSRLKPGGIAALWVPAPAFDADFQQAAATFAQSFPHTAVWSYPNAAGLLLLGSDRPLDISLHSIRAWPGVEAKNQEAVRKQLGLELKGWTENWLPQVLRKSPRALTLDRSPVEFPFIRWLNRSKRVVEASDLWANPLETR